MHASPKNYMKTLTIITFIGELSPPHDSTLTVPRTRRGRIIEDYPAYHYALKTAIQRYENGRETNTPFY